MYDIMHSLATSFPCSWFLYLVGLGNCVDYVKSNMKDTHGLNGRHSEAVRGSEDQAVDFFNAHIEEVMLLSQVLPSKMFY